MQSADFHTEAKRFFGGGALEVRNYAWHGLTENTYCDPFPTMSFMIKPPPTPTRVRIKIGQSFTEEMRAGNTVFRPADLPFYCVNPGGNFRLLVTEFAPDDTFRRAGEELRGLATAPPNVDIRDGRIASALRRVVLEMNAPGFASDILVEAIMTTVIVELMRSGSALPDERSGVLSPRQLKRIDEMLHEGDKAPTVATIANELGISGRHLTRLFCAATGTTLSRHIARNQFDRACALLESTELPLKQIAYRVGFSSHSSFSAAFVREAGMSPSDFRRIKNEGFCARR